MDGLSRYITFGYRPRIVEIKEWLQLSHKGLISKCGIEMCEQEEVLVGKLGKPRHNYAYQVW